MFWDEKQFRNIYADPDAKPNELARTTKRVLEFEADPAPEISLIEGVPGAFLARNLMTPGECKQFIDITEELKYGAFVSESFAC